MNKKLLLGILVLILIVILGFFFWPRGEREYLGYYHVGQKKPGVFSNLTVKVNGELHQVGELIEIKPDGEYRIQGSFDFSGIDEPKRMRAVVISRQLKNSKLVQKGTETEMSSGSWHPVICEGDHCEFDVSFVKNGPHPSVNYFKKFSQPVVVIIVENSKLVVAEYQAKFID